MMITTPPEILYKYLGSANHHIDILRNLEIRFTQPEDLNDPFDCVPAITLPLDIEQFVDSTIRRLAEKGTIAGLLPSQIVNARSRMLNEYREEPEVLLKRSERIVRKNMNAIGVLSLSRRNDNMPLWAHYCGNHSGFVIGLRTNKTPLIQRRGDFLFEGELQQVTCQKERITIPCYPLELFPNMLFVKNDSWTYEEEWRVARQLVRCDRSLTDSSDVARFHMCTLEPSAVARVDVGIGASKELVDVIKKATALGTVLEHVEVFRAKLSSGGASLAFDRIED